MLAALKAEKADLESSLSKEKLQTIQLKHQVEEAESRNTDLYKVTSLLLNHSSRKFLFSSRRRKGKQEILEFAVRLVYIGDGLYVFLYT